MGTSVCPCSNVFAHDNSFCGTYETREDIEAARGGRNNTVGDKSICLPLHYLHIVMSVHHAGHGNNGITVLHIVQSGN